MDDRSFGVIAQAAPTDLIQRAIGGHLSALDIRIRLHRFCLEPDDKFVLVMGHAAGALYFCPCSS
jgi:hypothetical protein